MNKYMQVALRQAHTGMRKNEGGPFGAVVVKNGVVISKGHNQVLKTFDTTAHAEIVAIRKATRKLKTFDLGTCELYTTCEPCPMCLSAIFWSRISCIYYACTRMDAELIGFDDKKIYDMFQDGNISKHLNIKTIDRDVCFELFKEWEVKEDKIIY